MTTPTATPAQIDLVYRARKARVACAPEGEYDSKSRWYPSRREAGSGLTVRAPSAAHPYSYIKACCTKKHIQDLARVCPKYFAELVAEALPHALALYADTPKKLVPLLQEQPAIAAQVLAGRFQQLRVA